MFEPVLIVSASARYSDLLQEAEAERKVKPWRFPLLLGSILLALGLGR
ncbi:MAG: hypothetical protein QME94_04700 [Anaerolineae bacterium]|nr:hypothetical protein [Anaerolineae bacterium]